MKLFTGLIENEKDARLVDTLEILNFRGYIAECSKEVLQRLLREDHVVKYIENDGIVKASADTCYIQKGATWGIDRINERSPNIDNTYTYQIPPTAVDAFIVDTGIYIQHKDFGGRAVWGANFVDNQNTDCNGHGTHVSGTVGSTTYGVSKNVTLIAVKVLNCEGSGTNAGVLQGINYVAKNKNKNRPAVANMSLGGGYSQALNDAVSAAVSAGVVFAVAAGNENQNACNVSPASTPQAITVGATTLTADGWSDENVDQRASFSNWGTCVDIFAPGQDITSTWIGSTTATETISGTSMASPHVCGAAAVYLEQNPSASATAVANALVAAATSGVIDLACSSSACSKSPNSLLYSVCS